MLVLVAYQSWRDFRKLQQKVLTNRYNEIQTDGQQLCQVHSDFDFLANYYGESRHGYILIAKITIVHYIHFCESQEISVYGFSWFT